MELEHPGVEPINVCIRETALYTNSLDHHPRVEHEFSRSPRLHSVPDDGAQMLTDDVVLGEVGGHGQDLGEDLDGDGTVEVVEYQGQRNIIHVGRRERALLAHHVAEQRVGVDALVARVHGGGAGVHVRDDPGQLPDVVLVVELVAVEAVQGEEETLAGQRIAL